MPRKFQLPVEVEYLGWTGKGRNKTEAKKDAMVRIERAAGDYRPMVYQFRGSMAVAYRCPDGWYLDFLYDDKFDRPEQLLWGHGVYETKADAGRSARQWLAQQGWDGEETESPILLDDQQAEFARWVGFQRAYRHAESQGESDPHHWACINAEAFIESSGAAT